jgi:ribosomal protein S18 acetylase RimI-like enzyme
MLQPDLIHYRDATHEDVKALQELALVSYGRMKNDMTEQNWIKMQAVLTSGENFPVMVRTCFGFVCEEAGFLLGMAFLVPSGNPTKIYSPETSYIRMVGVHPTAGGRGIAQHLTRLCIEKAKETGEKIISLHSAEVMYAARHIYEKLGFKKIRLLDEHYGFKYWLYRLELE